MLATSNLTHYHLTDALLGRISLPSETMTVRMAGAHLNHGLNHKEVTLGVNEKGQTK